MIIKSAQKNENVFQMFDFGILKELVITVGNKSILINTPFRFETIWVKDLGAPRGTIFEKNQMNLLIMSVQAIGHKIPDLETSSQILWKSGNKKWWVF